LRSVYSFQGVWKTLGFKNLGYEHCADLMKLKLGNKYNMKI